MFMSATQMNIVYATYVRKKKWSSKIVNRSEKYLIIVTWFSIAESKIGRT